MKIFRVPPAFLLGLSVILGGCSPASTEHPETKSGGCYVNESGFFNLENTGPISGSPLESVLKLKLNQSDLIHSDQIKPNQTGEFQVPVGFLVKGDSLDAQIEPGGNAPAGVQLRKVDATVVESVKNKPVSQTGVFASFHVTRPGFYGLANARISSGTPDAGAADVRVFVGGCSPLLRKAVRAGESISFDSAIGWLCADDTINFSLEGQISQNGRLAVDYDLLYLPMEDIGHQILAAQQKKVASVRIYPGRYYLKPENRAAILMKDCSDFEVNAYGVTMILRGAAQQILNMVSCRNVVIEGFTADADPFLFTQGTIRAVADNGSFVDFELHEGYPAPNNPAARQGMVFDARTHLRKKFSRDFPTKDIKHLEGNVYRIETFLNATNHGWAVGDYISLVNQGGHQVYIQNGEHIQLIDLVFHSLGAGWGITEAFSNGTLYKGLQLRPGPRPLLATVDRLRSTDSDGIHSRYATLGPRIENCSFEALGDDAIAIHGGYGIVMNGSDSDTIDVALEQDIFRVGDQIRTYSSRSGMATRTIETATPVGIPFETIQTEIRGIYPRMGYPKSFKQVVRLKLNEALVMEKGDLIASKNRNGNGFIVRNNVITNTRARGIIIKASDGLIEGNTISHAALPGILVVAETGAFMEADVSENLTIRRNILDSCNEGYLDPGNLMVAGAIATLFDGKDFMGHRAIRIEDNQFINIPGPNIQVNHASDVQINRNTFSRSHQFATFGGAQAGVNTGSLIWVGKADGVTLGVGADANHYDNLGPFADKNHLLGTTVNSKNVTGDILPKDADNNH